MRLPAVGRRPAIRVSCSDSRERSGMLGRLAVLSTDSPDRLREVRRTVGWFLLTFTRCTICSTFGGIRCNKLAVGGHGECQFPRNHSRTR